MLLLKGIVKGVRVEEGKVNTQTGQVNVKHFVGIASPKQGGYTDEEIGSHAGLADTSLTLALAPQLVRSDRLGSAEKPTAAQGVYGDPRRATAELGQVGVEIIVSQTVDAIRKATGHP